MKYLKSDLNFFYLLVTIWCISFFFFWFSFRRIAFFCTHLMCSFTHCAAIKYLYIGLNLYTSYISQSIHPSTIICPMYGIQKNFFINASVDVRVKCSIATEREREKSNNICLGKTSEAFSFCLLLNISATPTLSFEQYGVWLQCDKLRWWKRVHQRVSSGLGAYKTLD